MSRYLKWYIVAYRVLGSMSVEVLSYDLGMQFHPQVPPGVASFFNCSHNALLVPGTGYSGLVFSATYPRPVMAVFMSKAKPELQKQNSN